MGCCRHANGKPEPIADRLPQTKGESEGIAFAGCCSFPGCFTRSFTCSENTQGAGSGFSRDIPFRNAKAEEGIAVPSNLCRHHADASAEADPAGFRDSESPESEEVCNAFGGGAGGAADA
jgi:hypothetical protein